MCLGRWPGAGSRESRENPGDDGYASDKRSERKRLENPEDTTKFSKGQNCPQNFHGSNQRRPHIFVGEIGRGRAKGPEVGKVVAGLGENPKIFLEKEKGTRIGGLEESTSRTFGRREIRIVEASRSQGVPRGKQQPLPEEVKESDKQRGGQQNFGRRGKSLENLCRDRTNFGQVDKCSETTRGSDIKSRECKDSQWELEFIKGHGGRGLENCKRKEQISEVLNRNNETSLEKTRIFGKGRGSPEYFGGKSWSGSRRREKAFEFLHKKEITYLLKSRKFEKDLENSICRKETLEWRKRKDLNDLRRRTKSLEILRKTNHERTKRFGRQEEHLPVAKKLPAWERSDFVSQRKKGRSLEALRIDANSTQRRKFGKSCVNCSSTKVVAKKSGKGDLDVPGRAKEEPEVAKKKEESKLGEGRAKKQVDLREGRTFNDSLRANEENLRDLGSRDKTVEGKKRKFEKPPISSLSTKEFLDHCEKGDLDKSNGEDTWTKVSENNTESSLDETANLKKQVKSAGETFSGSSLCRQRENLENFDRENITKNGKPLMVSPCSVKNPYFYGRIDLNELKRGTKRLEIGRGGEEIRLNEKPLKLSCLKIFNNSVDRKLINSLSTKGKIDLPNLKTETEYLNDRSKKEESCSDKTQLKVHLESSALKTVADNRKVKKSLENLVKDNEGSSINCLSVQVLPDQRAIGDLENPSQPRNFLHAEEKTETKKISNLLGTKTFETTLRAGENSVGKFVKDDSRSLEKKKTLSEDVPCSESEAVVSRAEESCRKGSEFPSGMGMLLPDETYEERSASSCHENDLTFDLDEVETAKALAALRKCDEFLKRHRIKPEFFCRHRERLALQAWLLQRAKVTSDASSSNEAVHLQQRLRSLSTELVTLRNRLHVSQPSNAAATGGGGGGGTAGTGLGTTGNGPLSKSPDKGAPSSPAPAVPPRTTLLPASAGPHTLPHNAAHTLTASAIVHPHGNHNNAVGHPVNANNNLISDLDLPKRHSGIHDDGIVSCVTARGCPRSPAISSIVADVKGLKSPNGNQPHQQRYPPKAGGPNGVGPATSTALDDLIHLPGPLTEDAVLKCLQARFCAKQYHTNVGPILVCINPYTDVGNPLTLTSTRAVPLTPQLNKVVQEAVRQQSETGYPQAIILSGTSGSGKTYASMLLLRQLFDVAGGGPETDAFKHLAAAFTVLRSLGSAKTATNSESSRIGHFIEVQVTDGALYRTKIHCYFLDQTRVIRPLPDEKNYHIFYQMLAGLSHEERVKLNLEGFNVKNLRYLQHGDTRQDEAEDASRFQAWKACLGVLGIPFLDVVRVLAAVLILGNVGFADGPGVEVTVIGENELASVASLLGVPSSALLRGLTSRTHNARGQLVKSVCDANMSNMTRDSLAKALYCRTVATIVRRANSLKRLGSTLGTLSSDSNESVHNQAEVTSQHASTIGSSAGGTGSRSMAALNNAVRHATDGFIGILDMFGFEDPKPSQLEHLCINLCAETMQHFYNTHIFKSSIESCRDEGIRCDVEVDYVDNVPCIDLISSLRTGLLSMLDVECSIRGTAESYVSKVKVQHKQNPRLFEPRTVDCRSFGIQHFAGRVTYDASDFLDTNKDVVPDDLVAVFYKHTCSFGFATHLFGSELKALYASDTVPRGVSFRISPTSHTDLLNGDEPISTLTQDFHTRLDNLLRTLVHARPHFVRCIRSNATETPMHLDRAVTMRQIRSLQVLETVNLMAGGYPHRMRFKAFNARYRLIAPFKQLRRAEEQAVEDTKLILQNAQQLKSKLGASTSWALGKRHIFLSEGIRQQLENLRAETRRKAATAIQATWRGWRVRRRWPVRRTGLSVTGMIGHKKTHQPSAASVQRNVTSGTATGTGTRPRPQPIAGTPPPDPSEKCADQKMIQQTCTLFGLDLERPPPVPPSRSYTVTGNTKLGYPQTRVMKMPFPEEGEGEVVLLKGETVLVVGASPRRGHLLVEHNNTTLHVPYQFMELKPCNINV